MSSPDAASPNPGAPPRNDGGPGNFVEDLVIADVAAGKNGGRVVMRFPPEPNGYLHIGHAKSICLNFGVAAKAAGVCNLRFDDTNPETEEVEYVDAIQDDIRWLGFDWGRGPFYASDYFEKLYEFAVRMIETGKAYVDTQTTEEIRVGRGDFYRAGTESPHRGRSVEDNLALFAKMRAGEMPDGSAVLRARGEMASADVKMRDPLMYRIRRAHHHRTGDRWCIYPMYDWAHGQSDYIEGVTHSVCSLEFQNHRPLYNWFLDQIGAPQDARPAQIEFAKLQLSYTVLSKRRLLELVNKGCVSGWDDPRMPTLAGLRRRGVTPEALRAFCDRIGVSTRDSVVDVTLLEHAIREHLNATSPRVMAVLRPLELVIDNWPEGRIERIRAPFDPDAPDGAARDVILERSLYVERDDFMEHPPKKYFRLSPGQEVRLRYGCVVRCTGIDKNEHGEVVRVHATWDETSLGGTPADNRKIKGTVHWVAKSASVAAQVRLYDRLFCAEHPMADKDHWLDTLNPRSLETLTGCRLEAALADAKPFDRFQFERVGYFCVDPDSRPGCPVYNRTIGLRDSWAAIAAKQE